MRIRGKAGGGEGETEDSEILLLTQRDQTLNSCGKTT